MARPSGAGGSAQARRRHIGKSRNMLELRDVHACYGRSHVLHGVSLTARRGEVVCLLGRNGAGKSTTLKAIVGLVDLTGGRSSSMVDHSEAWALTRSAGSASASFPKTAG